MFTHINNNLKVLNDVSATKRSSRLIRQKLILYSKRGEKSNQNLNAYMYGHYRKRKQFLAGTFAINTSKHIITEKHLEILYYSLIYPYLHYVILLCGNALIKHIIRGIQIVQKKCVRTIFGANFNAPIFKQLEILKFLDIYELYTCLFMFNFVNGGLPSPLLGIYQSHIAPQNRKQLYIGLVVSLKSGLPKRTWILRHIGASLIEIYMYMNITQGQKVWASLDGRLTDSRTQSLFKTLVSINMKCITMDGIYHSSNQVTVLVTTAS